MAKVTALTDEGFMAAVRTCEDPAFAGLTPAQLMEHLPNRHRHRVLLVVDAVTIRHPEHPLLAVDVCDEPGREFRIVPSRVQVLGDNLDTANMPFRSFADYVDADGVYRG